MLFNNQSFANLGIISLWFDEIDYDIRTQEIIIKISTQTQMMQAVRETKTCLIIDITQLNFTSFYFHPSLSLSDDNLSEELCHQRMWTFQCKRSKPHLMADNLFSCPRRLYQLLLMQKDFLYRADRSLCVGVERVLKCYLKD